jgi:hypothetical protein
VRRLPLGLAIEKKRFVQALEKQISLMDFVTGPASLSKFFMIPMAPVSLSWGWEGGTNKKIDTLGVPLL